MWQYFARCEKRADVDDTCGGRREMGANGLPWRGKQALARSHVQILRRLESSRFSKNPSPKAPRDYAPRRLDDVDSASLMSVRRSRLEPAAARLGREHERHHVADPSLVGFVALAPPQT